MDIDNDIDSQLLQQFSSMGTTDKEVLISQFQNLVAPNQVNSAACAFFLDMNNWNLQSAICSYYDYEQPVAKIPQMQFVKDVTIGEGESVPTNTNFVKTWRIMNSGDESWPPACSLKFISGEQFCDCDRVMVETLQPSSVTDISINMKSPSVTGIYQGRWRMCTPTGVFFGDIIWVIVQVEESGLLGLTQQLSQFGGELSSAPHHDPHNPFASPLKSPEQHPSIGHSPASVGHTPSVPCPSPSAATFPPISPISPTSHDLAHSETSVSSARTALFQTSPRDLAMIERPSSEPIPLTYYDTSTEPNTRQAADSDMDDLT